MNDTILYQNKYGVLLTPDIKLHRKYFDELVGLIVLRLTDDFFQRLQTCFLDVLDRFKF